ncbi:MAG: CBS domain-containing protein [Geminicoccaceae bacterium]
MVVKDLMTSNVAAVGPDVSVAVAARTMRNRGVGCLPVVEQGQVVGLITDRDLVERALAEGLDAHKTAVHSVMSAAPMSCLASQAVEEAHQMMTRRQVKYLPVLSDRGRLVGVLSYGDLAGHRPKCRPHEVRFFKKMSTSSGHQRNVALGTVYLSPATRKEEIPAAAIRRFERDHKVEPWSQLADGYEVVE